MKKNFVDFLCKTGVIKAEEYEIYMYGFNLLLKKVFHSCLILGIGFVTGEFFGFLFFLVAYASIREYSGGYHAKSEAGCYCCTLMVTICLLILLKSLQHLQLQWIWCVILFCSGLIWILSPCACVNNPLSECEKVTYRKITLIYLGGFGVISVLGVWGGVIAKGIACALIIQIVMLLLGRMEKQKT